MRDISVVVVTYNRLNMLKAALDLYAKQTFAPSCVIVVDNASTDETPEYLAGWESTDEGFYKEVITLSQNEGGAGGFYAGLDRALLLDPDWIWVADDDAFPESDALERVARFLDGYPDTDALSAVCGAVIDHDVVDISHRKNLVRRGLRVKEEFVPESEYKKEYFELMCFSYVGTVISRKKLSEAGLTKKEYFLCMDDTEHSLRLGKFGKIICIPDVRIHHDRDKDAGKLTWKNYYAIRNLADLIGNYFPGICYLYYCAEELLKSFILIFVRGERSHSALTRNAISDCMHGRFGIHKLYRPGWKP